MTPRHLALAAAFSALVCAAHAQAPQTSIAPPASKSTVQLMNTPRPLFFSDLVAFDTEKHRSLSLPAQRKDFAFAASAHLVPLMVADVSSAVHNYPVVFVQEGEEVVLVALTGLPNAGNRFVNDKGEWRPGTYIPAYVRGYPFIAVRPAKGVEPIIAFDPNAADFKAPDALPLVGADGQPSEQFKAILAFHSEYQALLQRTQAAAHALKAEGVIEAGQLTVQSADGKAEQIGGFWVVNEGKLRALSADALKRLMDVDALGLAYAHLLSMSNLPNLVNEVQATKDATTRRKASKKEAE